MEPEDWLPVLVAMIGGISTIAAASRATLSWSAPHRLRRRVQDELELAARFPQSSTPARALTVTARNAACELAARRLLRGRATSVTLGWLMACWALGIFTAIFLTMSPAERAILSDTPWLWWVMIVVPAGTVIFAAFHQARISFLLGSMRESLIHDGWYLDIADQSSIIADAGQDEIRYRPAARWSRGRIPHRDGGIVVVRRLERLRARVLKGQESDGTPEA